MGPSPVRGLGHRPVERTTYKDREKGGTLKEWRSRFPSTGGRSGRDQGLLMGSVAVSSLEFTRDPTTLYVRDSPLTWVSTTRTPAGEVRVLGTDLKDWSVEDGLDVRTPTQNPRATVNPFGHRPEQTAPFPPLHVTLPSVLRTGLSTKGSLPRPGPGRNVQSSDLS